MSLSFVVLAFTKKQKLSFRFFTLCFCIVFTTSENSHRVKGEVESWIAHPVHMIRMKILCDGYDFISLCIEKIVYPSCNTQAAALKDKTFVILAAQAILLEYIFSRNIHIERKYVFFLLFLLSFAVCLGSFIFESVCLLASCSSGCVIFDYNRLSFDEFPFLSLIFLLTIVSEFFLCELIFYPTITVRYFFFFALQLPISESSALFGLRNPFHLFRYSLGFFPIVFALSFFLSLSLSSARLFACWLALCFKVKLKNFSYIPW